MKSLTSTEARRYCVESLADLEVGPDESLCYANLELPGIIVHAPADARQILSFVSTVVKITEGSHFCGGFLWLLRYEVGPIGKAVLGWKTLESIRRAKGDLAGLDSAPAQHFREDERDELEIFLLQVLLFGWSGYFLPSCPKVLVNFRSSQRWVFYAKAQQELDVIFSELEEWDPSYEDFEGQSEAAERLYQEAEKLMANGDTVGAIAS